MLLTTNWPRLPADLSLQVKNTKLTSSRQLQHRKLSVARWHGVLLKWLAHSLHWLAPYANASFQLSTWDNDILYAQRPTCWFKKNNVPNCRPNMQSHTQHIHTHTHTHTQTHPTQTHKPTYTYKVVHECQYISHTRTVGKKWTGLDDFLSPSQSVTRTQTAGVISAKLHKWLHTKGHKITAAIGN